MPIITLTTDFGTDDWFVGTMKGVILDIAPTARLVDITHGIPHHDIRAGAFALGSSSHFFPRGTIHVAVVDPGVGSDRAPIAIRAGDHFFVGPDNGILSWAAQRLGVDDIFRIDNPSVMLANRSSTFHGRDIFAPVAAHLAIGLPLERLGARKADMVALPWPKTIITADHTIQGEVVYIDRFGNGITNIPNTHSTQCSGFLELSDGIGIPICDYYQSVPEGEAVIVRGSTDYLEIAIHCGNARDQFGLTVGTPVILRGAS